MAVPDTATLDARLDDLDAAIVRISGVLLDFENDPARILLPTVTLSGTTQTRWRDAAGCLDLAWPLFTLLRESVRAVTVERGTVVRLPSSSRETLFTRIDTPTVVVPDDALGQAAGIAGLDPPLASPAAMDDLIATILWLNRTVGDVLRDVASVWDQALPELTALSDTLDAVEQQSTDAGRRVPNDVSLARRLIDELRADSSSDPLGLDVAERLDPIRASVARAAAAFDDEIRASADADRRLDALGPAIDALRARTSELADRRAESVEKIVRTTELPSLEPVESDLRELEAAVRAVRDVTDDPPTAGRLDRLDADVAELSSRLDDLTPVLTADLDARRELRGRLKAYRAMAFSTGRAEDSELDYLLNQATTALYETPCDLQAANRLVLAYQRALRA
jgi:hypothetical protein